jgi:ABC-2 type transport system ATP-binding protein
VSPAIETTGLTKRFGGRAAVDDLDLTVPVGQVTGFIGPNGAGKTTAIRMLLGLARPSAGSARVLGSPLEAVARFLPRVGALVDGPAFYPRLSGRANLAVLARLRPRARTGSIDEVLDATGMTARADDRVGTYSMGMRQRLAIGAALLGAPDLVILDEPANGLDPAGIREIRALLRRLAAEGTTVLVSSHQLTELEQVCDHLVLLRDGRLIFQGPLHQLLAGRSVKIIAVPEHARQVRALAELVTELDWTAEIGDGRVTVTAPDESAAELNRRAHDRGITLAALWRRPPTLEETFLSLTEDPARGELP